MLCLWIWSKYIELCVWLNVTFKFCAGVKKEDTLPTILFSKEKLDMTLNANAGQVTEETDQSGNILCFGLTFLQI